jgi:hypothetical protein
VDEAVTSLMNANTSTTSTGSGSTPSPVDLNHLAMPPPPIPMSALTGKRLIGGAPGTIAPITPATLMRMGGGGDIKAVDFSQTQRSFLPGITEGVPQGDEQCNTRQVTAGIAVRARKSSLPSSAQAEPAQRPPNHAAREKAAGTASRLGIRPIAPHVQPFQGSTDPSGAAPGESQVGNRQERSRLKLTDMFSTQTLPRTVKQLKRQPNAQKKPTFRLKSAGHPTKLPSRNAVTR